MIYNIDEIKSILSDGGMLSKHLPNYSERQSQIDLADYIFYTYYQGSNLIAEAPTGIGKSIAGLIPAILMAHYNHTKTVIATSTKALQMQYYEKDLPFLSDIFSNNGIYFSYAMMKGRSNYICVRRFNEYASVVCNPETPKYYMSQYNDIAYWMNNSLTGDFESMTFEIYPEIRSEICCSQDDCDGRDCEYSSRCFYKKMKSRAKNSDIILVNTDLLCIDLILRNKHGAAVIPNYHHVIIDEAHELEDIFSKYCGFNISEFAVKSAIAFAMKYVNRLKKDYCKTDEHIEQIKQEVEALDSASVKLMKRVRSFFDNFIFDTKSDTVAINNSDFDTIVNIAAKKVKKSLSDFSSMVTSAGYYTSEEVMENMQANVIKKLDSVYDRFTNLMKLFDEEDNENVYWVTYGGRNKDTPIIESRPVDVSNLLHDCLFDRKLSGQEWDNLFTEMKARGTGFSENDDDKEQIIMPVKNVVLMSATMTTNRSFDFIKKRLGVYECDTTILPHAFDYQHNALLYIPRGLVEPNITSESEVFTRQLAQNIVEIAEVTEGKMLCLFTSYAEMKRVFDIVQPQIGSKYNMFNQSQYPKSELSKMFKSDINSILFATSSFWTGFDVQGDALSALVIDRIPFPVPTDPLIEARINKIKSDGGNWFNDYYIPMACMELCQGFGRLIRTKTDMGIVAIMDVRLITKPYGQKFIYSFPPTLKTRSIDKVKLFYDVVKKKRERLASKNE